MNIRIALIGLLLLIVKSAHAYPASEVPCWKGNQPGATCQLNPSAAANLKGAYDCGRGDCAIQSYCGQSGYTCNATLEWWAWDWTHAPYDQSVTWNIFNVQNTPTLGCPNGGTLSGNTCVCGAGETDTGSACTQPAGCPGGQFRRSAGDACEEKCPENEHQGGHEFDPGEQTVCVTRREFVVGVGWSNVTGAGVTEIKCRARVTDGTSVCADMGQGTRCYADSFRTTGSQNAQDTGECSEDPPIQIDNEDICAAGDLWCKPNPGCPAGFTKGEFNGKDLCVKNGESISNVPQTKSPLVPAYDPDEAVPPDPFDPAPTGGDGEEEDPNLRRVIGIGDGATGVGAGGGSIEVDIETCGLPGKPPCKIDETGTPTGAGFGDSEKGTLDSEAGKLTTKFSDIQSGTGAPDRSWGFTITFPSTCTPIVLNTPWQAITLDFCQWQSIVHDLMSMIWAAFTLWFCFGMVSRAFQAG